MIIKEKIRRFEVEAKMRAAKRISVYLSILAMFVSMPAFSLGQTRVQAPKNPYKPSEDVQLGRQAAAEAEQQFPVLNDREVQNYIQVLGRRLTEAIPREFYHSEFQYSYKVVNVRDLNAFALPGGFTYVNRGLIEAAKTEGELAGVMAHEISHVALRHGTANYAKAKKGSILAGIAAIGGAILGGQAGAAIGQTVVGAYYLKYSREYERQADTLGAQIMAQAGYDPRDLANMFRTIEAQGSSGGPEWLSSHPNPGNRYEAIHREAQILQVRNPIIESPEFSRVRARLRDLGRAPSMEEAARSGGSNRRRTTSRNSRDGELPSRTLETYRAQNGIFEIRYPSNWDALDGQTGATFAPAWAIQGNDVTRGAIVGIGTTSTRNLNQAMNELVNNIRQSNTSLREEGSRVSERISGRNGLSTYLIGRGNTGASERVFLAATLVGTNVVYVLFIAPEQEFRQYETTFDEMFRSLALNNR